MTNPFATQRDKYMHTVHAEALLFKGRGGRALRLEAETIGLEFTDSAYIGSDPEGIFSYSDLSDFIPGTADAKATYQISQLSYKKRPDDRNEILCLKIIFTHDGASRPFAEFIAEDPTDAVNRNDMNGHSARGEWKTLDLGSSTATVYKKSDRNDVTLSAAPLGHTAAWNVPDTSSLSNKTINVGGTIHFKHYKDLARGTIVNYSSDRLVFYDSVNARDFIAYFIPFEDGAYNKQDLMLATAAEFQPVKWSTT